MLMEDIPVVGLLGPTFGVWTFASTSGACKSLCKDVCNVGQDSGALVEEMNLCIGSYIPSTESQPGTVMAHRFRSLQLKAD